MANAKTFKVGEIELPVAKTPGEFTPHSQPFVENRRLLETLAFCIKEDLAGLLIGETGTGKTSAIRYLANQTNANFRRLNLNGQTTVDEFVGKNLINKDGTYWIDGILTDAMRKGHWLLLDEINAALPEVLFALQSLLDDDKYIVLSDKPEVLDALGNVVCPSNEVVRPHANFRIFASMNPSDNYVGTKELNKALMSRFPVVLEVDYPEEDRELEIVKARYPNVDEYEAKKLIEFGNELRQSYKGQEMDFVFDTRTLLNWIKINEHYKDWVKSAEVSFLSKCNTQDKNAILGVMKINFASNSIKSEELQVNDEVVIFDDIRIYNHTAKFGKKSTLKVTDKRTHKNMPVLELEVISVAKEIQGNDAYAQRTDRFGVFAADIDNRFQVKRKKK